MFGKVVWFAPPFSLNVKTNVRKRFLQLVDIYFPRTHTAKSLVEIRFKLLYLDPRQILSHISISNGRLLPTLDAPIQTNLNISSKKAMYLPMFTKGKYQQTMAVNLNVISEMEKENLNLGITTIF